MLYVTHSYACLLSLHMKQLYNSVYNYVLSLPSTEFIDRVFNSNINHNMLSAGLEVCSRRRGSSGWLSLLGKNSK